MKRISMFVAALIASACVNRDIVRPPEMVHLSAEEMAVALASDNFREVLAARAQLAELSDDTWLGVLARLAHDSQPQHRLVAAVELARRPFGAARTILAGLILDPDETVRGKAAELLAAAGAMGGAQ